MIKLKLSAKPKPSQTMLHLRSDLGDMPSTVFWTNNKQVFHEMVIAPK